MTKCKQSKRWIFRFIAVGLAALVAIAISEAMLWLIHPVPFREFTKWEPDGRIGRRAKPRQVIYNASGYGVRINQHGFRGPDWKPVPVDGTLRVLAFGGSSTFNFDATDEESTWPSRLQYYLENEIGSPVEVINLGMPGANLSHSKVNYLFLGRHLNPDVMLVYHTWNDMYRFRDLDAGDPYVFTNPKTKKPWWERVGSKMQIGRHAHSFLRAKARKQSEQKYRELENEGGAANEPVGSVAWQWFEQNFRDAARFANSDRVLPVLITQATIVQPVNLDRPEYRLLFKTDSREMTAPVIVATYERANEVIKRVADEESAVFVSGYDAVPPDFKHMTDFVHMTDKGLDTLAKEIAETLVQDSRFQQVVKTVQNESALVSTAKGE